jgi:hypothetical protein
MWYSSTSSGLSRPSWINLRATRIKSRATPSRQAVRQGLERQRRAYHSSSKQTSCVSKIQRMDGNDFIKGTVKGVTKGHASTLEACDGIFRYRDKKETSVNAEDRFDVVQELTRMIWRFDLPSSSIPIMTRPGGVATVMRKSRSRPTMSGRLICWRASVAVPVSPASSPTGSFRPPDHPDEKVC